jgi:hypothetical protein
MNLALLSRNIPIDWIANEETNRSLNQEPVVLVLPKYQPVLHTWEIPAFCQVVQGGEEGEYLVFRYVHFSSLGRIVARPVGVGNMKNHRVYLGEWVSQGVEHRLARLLEMLKILDYFGRNMVNGRVCFDLLTTQINYSRVGVVLEEGSGCSLDVFDTSLLLLDLEAPVHSYGQTWMTKVEICSNHSLLVVDLD